MQFACLQCLSLKECHSNMHLACSLFATRHEESRFHTRTLSHSLACSLTRSVTDSLAFPLTHSLTPTPLPHALHHFAPSGPTQHAGVRARRDNLIRPRRVGARLRSVIDRDSACARFWARSGWRHSRASHPRSRRASQAKARGELGHHAMILLCVCNACSILQLRVVHGTVVLRERVQKISRWWWWRWLCVC